MSYSFYTFSSILTWVYVTFYRKNREQKEYNDVTKVTMYVNKFLVLSYSSYTFASILTWVYVTFYRNNREQKIKKGIISLILEVTWTL